MSEVKGVERQVGSGNPGSRIAPARADAEVGPVSHADFLRRNGSALHALLSSRPVSRTKRTLPDSLLIFVAAGKPPQLLTPRRRRTMERLVASRSRSPLRTWTSAIGKVPWVRAGASTCVLRLVEKLGETSFNSTVGKSARWPLKKWEALFSEIGLDPREAGTFASVVLGNRAALPGGADYERVYRRIGVPLDLRGQPVPSAFRSSDRGRLGPLLARLALERCTEDVVPGGAVCQDCPVRLFCKAARFGTKSAAKGPEFIDLFAGAGGFSAGFRAAGFKLRCAVELDVQAADTFYLNHPEAPEGSVLRADVSILATDANFISKHRGIPVVIGGPPCQAFSIAHRHRGADKNDYRRLLFRPFVKLARALDARFIVMENVLGLRSAAEGRTVREIEEEFESAGFEVENRVVDSSSYGVPQRRRRVLFVAARRDSFADPASAIQMFWTDLYTRKRPGLATLRQALSGLPRVRAGGGALVMTHRPAGRRSKYALSLRARSRKLTLNHQARAHNPRDISIFRALHPGEDSTSLENRIPGTIPYSLDSYGDKYRKLRLDRPSPTIPAHLRRDANGFVHPELPRGITCREAARLQSFPDDYFFLGGFGAPFVQTGNAVPPLLAQAVAGATGKALSSQPAGASA